MGALLVGPLGWHTGRQYHSDVSVSGTGAGTLTPLACTLVVGLSKE